jgi:NADP-dependent 3-hydroxy acid dehydrogenase YdfG
MQTSPGIRDKVVAISGIGEATALLLAERGAKLVLGARGLARLEALAAGIANQGGEVSYASTDVRRRDDVCALVNLACELGCGLGWFSFRKGRWNSARLQSPRT